MKKMTRMILISAIFVTSGLTAKIANENYKAVATNDERIHKAYELAKKPNKAAVLEAIVDATKAESDERIQKAVVLELEEPKVVRVKTKVTTSAGVSPLSPTMDKKTVNKAEEFIEKVARPAEVAMTNSIDFTPGTIPVQELTYEIKDIFPEFEEVAEEAVVMYGWNYPWVMTWTKGEQTTTDANGVPLPTPIDHSTIIANMEKYSDANGLTDVDRPDSPGVKYVNDGVFTYYTFGEESESYERKLQYLVAPAGINLRTTTFRGNQFISNNPDTYITEISYLKIVDNHETYRTIFSIPSQGGSGQSDCPLEGNENIGYYGSHWGNSGKALYWYFNDWDGVDQRSVSVDDI